MRRIISAILIIAMLISMVLMAIPVSAAEGTAISNLSSIQAGGKYYLSANVTISSSWTPLNLNNVTLDGNGKTITITDKSVFGTVSNLTVKNLTIAGTVNSTIPGADGAFGALAQTVSGKCSFENVTSNVNMTFTNNQSEAHFAVGGIVGSAGVKDTSNDITFLNCKNNGTIITPKQSVPTYTNGSQVKSLYEYCRNICTGGIVGHTMTGLSTDKFVFSACVNNGGISSDRGAGIVCGLCNKGLQNNTAYHNVSIAIDNCTNNGKIYAYSMAGGLVADATNRAHLSAEGINIGGTSTITVKVGSSSGPERQDVDALMLPQPNLKITNSKNTAEVVANGDVSKLEVIYYGTNFASTKDRWNSWVVVAGGIVGYANRATIDNCTNTGTVDVRIADIYNTSMNFGKTNASAQMYYFGGRNVGGIVGGKIQSSFSTIDGSTGVHITNSNNSGEILGVHRGIGGIMGSTWIGRVQIENCVNSGKVVATSLYANDVGCAGGIFGWVNGDNYTNAYEKNLASKQETRIENCINTGLVEVKLVPGRDADGYMTAGGIVGSASTGIRIAGCVNTGTVKDGSAGYISSFPMMNPLEMQAGTASGLKPKDYCSYSNNYYLDTSVEPDRQSTYAGAATTESGRANYHTSDNTANGTRLYLYLLSTKKTSAQVKSILSGTTYNTMFDVDGQKDLEALVTFANAVISGSYASKYNADQKAQIQVEITKSNAVLSSSEDVFVKQSKIADQYRALQEALANYTDTATYTVYIPATVKTNSETDINISVSNFSYFAAIEVKAAGNNDYTLTHTDGTTKTTYSMEYQGGDGYMKFAAPRVTSGSSVADTNGTLTSSFVARAANGSKDGLYSGRISFEITYHKSKVY